MVSATLVDTISSPIDALTSLFQEWSNGSRRDHFADVVSNHFSSIFSDERAMSQVPLLDADLIVSQSNLSRTLLRFPAMVQDTSPSPELYISQDGNRCCGWGLNEVIQLDSDSKLAGDNYSNLKERSILWAVDIPGIAPWQFVDQATQISDPKARDGMSGKHLKHHKTPLRDSGPSSAVVQVKIYQSTAENLKPTDLVNFVGILTFEEELSEMNESDESNLLFPTLHVLFYQPLPKSVVPRNYPMPNFKPSTRNALLRWLADEALQGDSDAAEWILLGCISSMQSRNPPVLPLSITISQFKNDTQDMATPTLTYVLREILTLSAYLPLSLNRLNTHKFIPESVNEDLHAGFLQLPKGTVLILSDHEVEDGHLSDKGMQNLAAIQEVVKQQMLRYDFPFSHFSFETEISVIILTGGRKSAFCETDVTVPLKATRQTTLYGGKSSVKLPEQHMLNNFRDLIGSARHGKTTISEDTSKKIQSDFVTERQRDKIVSSDDLIRRMTIARLLALSHHKQEITEEIWSAAKALDERRIERCNSLS